jgi:hypothetical protein
MVTVAMLVACAGCSVTVPVAIVTSRGETLHGTATSDLFAGGSFEAASDRVHCTGNFDVSSGSQTVSLAAHCSDGATGIGQAVRDTPSAGSGRIQMNDGTQARFIFGRGAAGI